MKTSSSFVAISLAAAALLAGCGSGQTTGAATDAATAGTTSAAGAKTPEVRKVKVAYNQASKPISWLDEKDCYCFRENPLFPTLC